MVKESNFLNGLQRITEAYLTRRRKIRRLKKEKQKKKHFILDWVEAFIWAAGVVLLINQYLFQAYQIPSGSMETTLLIGDRIFVNKAVYGPELLPGLTKLPSPIKPLRNDVIIFENPSYDSQGPAFDIAQRIIYMLTLSLVDIDKDEYGQPKPHFLIKRAVGMGGDRYIEKRGEMQVRFAGEERWVKERDFIAARGYTHQLSRFSPGDYTILEKTGYERAIRDTKERKSPRYTVNELSDDHFALQNIYFEVRRAAAPHEQEFRIKLARLKLGIYVPEGRILPLGDNRINSRDGRYFGPVREAKILGQGALKYWPSVRFGPIR
ncbi:MAG: signal peptidase I [Treponema sp.]|jgi:signal peptidase I|nr:signal peptidase I [Treponema sp.]